jgi:hypothetical protein
MYKDLRLAEVIVRDQSVVKAVEAAIGEIKMA